MTRLSFWEFAQMLPKAVKWAEQQEQIIQQRGRELDAPGIELACKVGVARPERIRCLVVPAIPAPSDRELRDRMDALWQWRGILALHFGYGIYFRSDYEAYGKGRIRAHEFRHVHQFEAEGARIAVVMPRHLRGYMDYGANSPHEVDARAHEYLGSGCS